MFFPIVTQVYRGLSECFSGFALGYGCVLNVEDSCLARLNVGSVAGGTPDTRVRVQVAEIDIIFDSYYHDDTQLLRERKHFLYSIYLKLQALLN